MTGFRKAAAPVALRTLARFGHSLFVVSRSREKQTLDRPANSLTNGTERGWRRRKTVDVDESKGSLV
jgi:hypothetical protein